MRTLMLLLLLLGALLAGSWIGGETLLARSARQAIAADPRIEAAAVNELRDTARIGVRIEAPRFADPQLTAAGDWLDIWVTPTAPNELHAALAPTTEVAAEGRTLALGPQGAEAALRFSPTHSLALSEAEITARSLTLDGQPALSRLVLNATLGGFGADAPAGAGAAYDLSGAIEGLALPALTDGALTGEAGAAGGGRVWLSAVPLDAGDVTDGQIGAHRVRLVGLRADGVDVTVEGLRARLYGRMLTGEDGLAEGELLIDTADAGTAIDRAAALGLIPGGMVVLAKAALGALSQAPEPPPPAAGGVQMPAHVAPEAFAWPMPRAGEVRIPLTFHDGRTLLGPLPVGPAPRLADAAVPPAP